MNPLSKTVSIVAIAFVIAGTAAFALAPHREMDPVARGGYLVRAMGCNDCHTPWQMTEAGPAPDLKRMLSGHPASVVLPPAPKGTPEWPTRAAATMTAWSGPWGTSFTANLTPDEETGLGRWTADEFIAALRTGRHQGRGRQILPPMPWPMTSQLDDADLKAIFAFLHSIPAIRNRVPEPLPPQQD